MPFLFPWVRLSLAHSGGIISRDDVTALLRKGGLPPLSGSSDAEYRVYPQEAMEQLMRFFRKPEPSYCADLFDCDDYTICFLADMKRGWSYVARPQKVGLALGEAAIRLKGAAVNHRLAWAISPNGILYWIEPQSNRIVTPDIFSVIDLRL